MACDAASSLDAYASASLDAEQLHALTNLTSLLPGKQQSPPDRELVWRALKTRCNQGARFLVFGRGMDSDFWAHTMNANGLTVFLEATPAWATGDPTLTTHLVRYHTAPLRQWNTLLSKRDMPLPANLTSRLRIDGVPHGLFELWWDVILIDAPVGVLPYHPGRLAPIYQSAQIIARQRKQRPFAPVDVFVHDFNRWTEREAGLRFLLPHARLINDDVREALHASSRTMAWFHVP